MSKMRGGGDGSDVRRLDRQQRYRVLNPTNQNNQDEDLSKDYMSTIGMVFSMCGIMLKLKWCAWVALYCSCVSFANTKVNDSSKHIYSSFMLSFSAIAVSYLQNPQPMSPPWTAGFSP